MLVNARDAGDKGADKGGNEENDEIERNGSTHVGFVLDVVREIVDLKERKSFLKENMNAHILFWNGRAISVLVQRNRSPKPSGAHPPGTGNLTGDGPGVTSPNTPEPASSFAN
jgi:hypothetical protein